MARYGSADVGWLIANGYNILGDITNLEDNREALLEEVTALGDAYEAHAAIGVQRWTLTQRGFFNDATGRSNTALLSPGGCDVLSFAPEGNTLGNKFVGAQGIQADYTRQLERGGLHKASASYESRGEFMEGLILFPLQTVCGACGDSTCTPLDGTSCSACGGIAFLQITDLCLSCYCSFTVTIIDDADDCGCYATLQAFTTATAIGGQVVEVSGCVERYTAVQWAFVGCCGCACCATATFTVGFKRD